MSCQCPYLGMKFPEDLCIETDLGTRCLRDYRGRWLLVFTYPGDFRPICGTELADLSLKFEEFKKRGVELLGLSVDSVSSHIEFRRHIEQVFGVRIPFPLASDGSLKLASMLNAVPPGKSHTMRVVALLAPDLTLAWYSVYPAEIGRNIDEILRVIDAVQFRFLYGFGTPANWRIGEKVVLLPPRDLDAAEKRLRDPAIECKTWWLCYKSYQQVVEETR